MKRYESLAYDTHEHGILFTKREIFVGPSYLTATESVDYHISNQFIRNMRILETESDKPIIIHLNTCGGCWNYGMAMYDKILNSPCHVTTISYSHARSMSSIIPQAADKRVIMPSADFLVHMGTIYTEGTHDQVLAEVNWTRTISVEKMLDVYTEKCQYGEYFKGKTWQQTRNYIKKQIKEKVEWYMTPEEAVNKGFMDGVFGTEDFTEKDIFF